MPNPRGSEGEGAYVSRFMKSKHARGSFRDPKQRAAVAHSIYRKRKGKKR